MGALDFVLDTDAAYLPVGTAASEFPWSALSGVNVIVFFPTPSQSGWHSGWDQKGKRCGWNPSICITPQEESLWRCYGR